jgi:hypothetical protein
VNYIVHCLSLISHWRYRILGKVVEYCLYYHINITLAVWHSGKGRWIHCIVCFTSIDRPKVKDLVGIFLYLTMVQSLCLYEVPTVVKSLKQAVCYLENIGSKDNIYTIVFCLITSQSDLFLWSLTGENI